MSLARYRDSLRALSRTLRRRPIHAGTLSTLGAVLDRLVAGLLSRVAGVDQVVTPEQTLPPFDLVCPIMSLADPSLVAAWRQHLSPAPGLRCDLVWPERVAIGPRTGC